MQWLVRWYSRIQRLWFAVKRFLLGLLPLFGVDPSKWRAWVTRRPRGSAVPARSFLDRFVRSEATVDHPVVDALRHKATNELFDWLGLAMIPRQTWAILDKVGDPAAAIEQLIRALGCDPLAARRREPGEIARLEAAIDVLIAVDSLRRYLSADQLSEIEYLLFGGDYDAVMTYSRVVAAFSAVHIGQEKAARLRRFAVYESFVQTFEGYRSDPWSLAPTDAEEALRLSDRLVTTMERYTDLYAAISEAIATMRALWPGSGAGAPEAETRDRLQWDFEAIDDRLVNDPSLDVDRIDDLLRDASELLEACRVLLEDFKPDTGDNGDAGDTTGAPRNESDEALVFFGFAARSSPSWEEIKKAYRAVMKKLHPDLAGAGAEAGEAARREDLAKRANMHRDLLRRRYPEAR